MPNSRNLSFFKVVWHEKILLGKCVVVWHHFLQLVSFDLTLLDYFQPVLLALLMLFDIF